VDKGRGTGNSRGLEKNAEFVSDSGELFSFTGTQALGGVREFDDRNSTLF